MPLTLAALLFLPLVILATLRLTRLVTSDWLGEWMIIRPAKAWAAEPEHEAVKQLRARLDFIDNLPIAPGPRATVVEGTWRRDAAEGNPFSWQARLVKGLECPFCVGYWIGLAILVVTTFLLWLAPAGIVLIWGLLLGSLGLNYLVGHTSSRLD